MKKPILNRVDKNKKVKFDQTQLSKVISLLNSIIGKEKDAGVRNGFRNIKAILIGTYPNLYALKQSAIGLKKAIKNITDLLTEEENIQIRKKKKLVKNILSKFILILTASIGLASCSFNVNYDYDASSEVSWNMYGARLITQSYDGIYSVRLSDTLLTQLENALNEYIKSGNTSGLSAMDIKFIPSKGNGVIGTTDEDGKIEVVSTVNKYSLFNVMSHELTHRKQFSDKYWEFAGYNNGSLTSYAINPHEVNSNFSSLLQQLKYNKSYLDNGVRNTVATLLTYRPTYEIIPSRFPQTTVNSVSDGKQGYSSADIKMVHEWVRLNNILAYSIAKNLMTASTDVVKSYFMNGTVPASLKSISKNIKNAPEDNPSF